jgi:hypothetical protein
MEAAFNTAEGCHLTDKRTMQIKGHVGPNIAEQASGDLCEFVKCIGQYLHTKSGGFVVT